MSVADELRGKIQKLKRVWDFWPLLLPLLGREGVGCLATTANYRLDFELRMNKIIFGVYYYYILHRAIQPSQPLSLHFFTHRRRSTLVKLGRLTSRMKIKFYLFKTYFPPLFYWTFLKVTIESHLRLNDTFPNLVVNHPITTDIKFWYIVLVGLELPPYSFHKSDF